MGTEKRDRQKANRAARQAAEQEAQAKAKRMKTIRNFVLFGVGIIVVAVLLSLVGCSDNDDTNLDASGDPSAQSTSETSDGDADEDTVDDAAGSDDESGSAPDANEPPAYGSGECPAADGPSERTIEFTDAPQLCIDPEQTYSATFQTTEGDFKVELDAAESPITVNNFVVLARYGFYDGTDIFRTEAASGILQGGSPHTQSNTDPGPGYTILDENLPYSADDYGPGTLAMARTSMPHSAGGQFFLLANEGGRYLGDPAQLGPSAGSYAVFGRTTEGLDVLQAIAALDDGSSSPSKQVTITKVTITES